MISEHDIRRSLHTKFFGGTIYTFDSIDSTNTFARSLKENDRPDGTLIVADEQTAGKGRQGRRWSSQKGMNLLFSVITRPLFVQEKIRVLPFGASLAVADAIEQKTKIKVDCKWPNDVLIDGGKVAGMLIETTTQDDAMNVILGIGVNVNQTEFADDIKTKATSLKLHSRQEIDRVQLLCAILEELEHRFEQLRHFSPQIVLDEWKRRTTMLGAEITLVEHQSSIRVRAKDVAPSGALIIEELNGRRREVFAGDVSILQ